MKLKIILIAWLIVFSVRSNAQQKIQNDSITQNDGPYIISVEDKYQIITTQKGEIDKLEVDTLPTVLQITTSKGNSLFDVQLYEPSRPDWKYKQPDSLLILSDPHGNFDAMISVLQANHVINQKMEWTYGRGHLVVIGDVFDRGDDVLPIYWLLYKLDREAQCNGGQLHFLYGNHEDMVLRNNLKYTNLKYKELAKKLAINYNELWGGNSVLGKWLSTKNTIEVIGDRLFVHAGISPQVLDLNLSIPEMNQIISQYIGTSKEERKENPTAEFLFSNAGILWYRGMVKSDEKYDPLNEEQLDQILKYFGINQIVVGHTIFEDVSSFFGDKVIAVNVNNQRNMDNEKSRGLLVKNGKEFLVFDKSVPHPLPEFFLQD